ncbi:hypothetical protein B0H16DRAFT_1026327 [Mycena metata]|uniref:Uncharacterized protein n=1 Tax=Mycena metata TaxID=1033252 RepID=A0AAD7N1B4_9AGAR|nr:hypothetical protein B0H16DRAFT_1026327 [Mycena metata]
MRGWRSTRITLIRTLTTTSGKRASRRTGRGIGWREARRGQRTTASSANSYSSSASSSSSSGGAASPSVSGYPRSAGPHSHSQAHSPVQRSTVFLNPGGGIGVGTPLERSGAMSLSSGAVNGGVNGGSVGGGLSARGGGSGSGSGEIPPSRTSRSRRSTRWSASFLVGCDYSLFVSQKTTKIGAGCSSA